MRMELLLSVFAAVNGAAQAASVCEILNHRLDLNGKPVEISGTLSGGPLSGYFVCETKSCDPCVNRWIFSWPSAILLAPLPREREEELHAQLARHIGESVKIVVKGRLRTKSDYYVINLPLRDQRPLGRFEFGGVAAGIDISEIVFLK